MPILTKAEIQRLVEGATKGKWYAHGYAVSLHKDQACVGYPPSSLAICSLNDMEYIANENEHDAEFIASAPDIASTAIELYEENEMLKARIHNEYAMDNIKFCTDDCEKCREKIIQANL